MKTEWDYTELTDAYLDSLGQTSIAIPYTTRAWIAKSTQVPQSDGHEA